MSRTQTRSQSRTAVNRKFRETFEKPTIRYPTRFQKRVAADPVGYAQWKKIQPFFMKQTQRVIKEIIGIGTYLKKMWTIWRRSTQDKCEFHRMINEKLSQFQKSYSFYVPMLHSAKEFFQTNLSNLILIRQTNQKLTESLSVLNKFKKVFGMKV